MEGECSYMYSFFYSNGAHDSVRVKRKKNVVTSLARLGTKNDWLARTNSNLPEPETGPPEEAEGLYQAVHHTDFDFHYGNSRYS
jgi:hypothetical protein